jgi:DNA-binding transcriptional LysR family regulator
LGISQPAISNLISQLEKHLGFALFTREKKRMHPTPKAEVFFAEVERAFSGIDRLTVMAKDMQSFMTGRVRLVMPQALVISLVPDIVKSFRRIHPRVELAIEYLPSKEAADGVAAHQFDFGVARLPITHPGVEVEILMRSESVCVIPAGHPLASHEAISPLDLKDELLVLQSLRHEARFAINDAFRAVGIDPKVNLEIGALTGACEFAASGIGITIVDGLMASALVDRGIVIRRFVPPIINDFATIYPRGESRGRAVSDFLDCTKKLLSTQPEFCIFPI